MLSLFPLVSLGNLTKRRISILRSEILLVKPERTHGKHCPKIKGRDEWPQGVEHCLEVIVLSAK